MEEERIKKAKEMYYRRKLTSNEYKLLEELFPELEDGRINRTLSRIFYEYKNNLEKSIGEKEIEDCINWLYKHQTTEWRPSKDEMDTLFSLAYLTHEIDDDKDATITKLYKELKYHFFDNKSYENMFPNYAFENTEDNVRRVSIIKILEYAKSLDAYNQYGKEDIEKNIKWLKEQGGIKELN